MLQLKNQLEQGEDNMELILMFLGIVVIFAAIEHQIQTLKDEISKLKFEESKQKQFKRKHSSVSKTNFRKYIEWSNRCICKV